MGDAPSHRWFARCYDPLTAPAEGMLAPHRERLVAGLDGRVLDVGTGTGAMVPYLGAADVEAVGLEPDPHMRRRAARLAAAFGRVELVGGVAERLPFADDAFDAAVSALVFCTVADPDRALDELARTIRPGGELRFLEHVHGEGMYGRVQSACTPLWERVAGGCHLDRDTAERFAADPRFETLECERVGPTVPPVAPFVRGRLRRRD